MSLPVSVADIFEEKQSFVCEHNSAHAEVCATQAGHSQHTLTGLWGEGEGGLDRNVTYMKE